MSDNNKRPRRVALRIVFLVVLVIASVIIIARQRNTPYQHNTGFIFGTVYNITYQSSSDLQPEIEAEAHARGQFRFRPSTNRASSRRSTTTGR